MNSMFSVFDALSAEFLRQAVRSSFASTSTSTTATNKEGNNFFSSSRGVTKKAVAEFENMKMKKQGGNVEKKQQRAPRFAPELDGLNCFETIVSH